MLRRELLSTAAAIAAARDFSMDDAVKVAKDLVEKRTLFLNGQAIISPYITKEKLAWAQHVLTKVYEDNKAAIKATYDLHDPKSLSLRPDRGGNFSVVTQEGEPINVPVVQPDGSFQYRRLTINAADIDRVGATLRDMELGKQAENAQRAFEDKLLSTAPRNLSPANREERERIIKRREAEAQRLREQRRAEDIGVVDPVYGAIMTNDPHRHDKEYRSLLESLFGSR
jgi:hypothetical protein